MSTVTSAHLPVGKLPGQLLARLVGSYATTDPSVVVGPGIGGDAAAIDLGSTIDVLVIAVIGGLYRIEGAWVGALFFVVINNYSQQISFIGPRFHTLIGAIFLVIVLVSPGGLVGLWERLTGLASGRRNDPSDRNPIEVGQVEPSV